MNAIFPFLYQQNRLISGQRQLQLASLGNRVRVRVRVRVCVCVYTLHTSSVCECVHVVCWAAVFVSLCFEVNEWGLCVHV